jgi:hypothetical protein
MSDDLAPARARWNGARFDPAGSYESWFLRANAPSSGDAFWIRYTLFADARAPHRRSGELWAIAFRARDGRYEVVADKTLCAFDPTALDRSGLALDLGDARLRDGEARGAVGRLAWDLTWAGGGAPLLLLPEALYAGRFPKAKALVPRPLVRFAGRFAIDGEELGGEGSEIDGWIGSQNHNWGSRHTDEYAWGQVAGFDGAPDTFLEVSTARVKLGPVKTPWLTPIVLRDGARELRFSTLLRAARNRGRYDERAFVWTFAGEAEGASIEGHIEAPREAFVALPYANPPGGTKTCLNTKVARCVVTLREGGRVRELVSERRAAFEILTDRSAHGIPVERLPDPRG